MMFLNSKGLVRLHGTLFLQSTNPVETPVMLTVITIYLGAKLLTNSPPKTLKTKFLLNSGSFTDKKAEVIRLPPSIPAHPSKKVLEKLKFFGKGKKKKPMSMNKAPQKQLYAQVIGPSVSDILKLKENYSNLPAKKIENIQRIINELDKSKP